MAKSKKGTAKHKGRPAPPIVLSINLCDTIIRDESTKKVSLIGLFSVIHSQTFPVKHPEMHVYVALTNGHGQQDIDVRFVPLDSNNPLVGIKGQLNFQNPLQVVELNLKWRGVEFSAPGEYLVEVLCNGNRIGDRKFEVINPNTAPRTNGTGG